MKTKAYKTGIIGISSVVILILSILVIGNANEEFSFTEDFISKLGTQGQPNALWYNIFGFGIVGILQMAFGYLYGRILNDKWVSVLLSLFGLGFALTAIPTDIDLPNSPLSKAHILAICLGLASWLFGLSRLGYSPKINKGTKQQGNVTAILLVLSMVGFTIGLWSMPITHRLVFGIVFGWTALTSYELIRSSFTTQDLNSKL